MIKTELDEAFANGAKDIRKNRVQRDVNGNNGKYIKPDAITRFVFKY